MDHVEPGTLEQQEHREMREAADAGRRIGELSRPLTDIVDELRQRADGQTRVDEQHEGIRANGADRLEILHRIVADAFHGRQNGDLGQGREKQGVAVRVRARDRLGCDRAARATLIIDNEGPAKALAQPLRHEAAVAVRIAARGKGDKHPHRVLRVAVLRPDRRGQSRQGEGRGGCNQFPAGTHEHSR